MFFFFFIDSVKLAIAKTRFTTLSAIAEKPSCSKDASTVDNREITKLKVKCHEDLLDVCRNFATERSVTMSSIMNLSAIKNMSETLPVTKEEFLNIQYVTKANFEKFGESLLTVTKKYKKECDKIITKETKINKPSFNDFNSDSYNYTPQREASKTKRRYKRKRKTPKKKTYSKKKKS